MNMYVYFNICFKSKFKKFNLKGFNFLFLILHLIEKTKYKC